MQTYKILGQTAPTANTETLNYTVPASTSTTIRSIVVTNTSSSSDTFSISLVPTAGSSATNANYIVLNNTIMGNSTISFKYGYMLPTGAGIRIKSTNGTSTFSTYGSEMS
jgi:hypothetical protein